MELSERIPCSLDCEGAYHAGTDDPLFQPSKTCIRYLVEQLEAERDCLLRGIKEWDLADAPDESVQKFLESASKGIYLAP